MQIRYCFIIISLLLLSACSQPTLPALSKNSTILAFGDSLTEGYGVSPEFSYPAILQSLSGIKVINAGLAGETTDKGLPRFLELLDYEDFDLVILLEGGNDILRNYDLTKAKSNLGKMIEAAQQRKIPVLLIGVPKKSIFSSSANFYSELAKEYKLPYEGKLIASLLKQNKYKSDLIHFNRAGYQLMAESILINLEKYGAL